MENELKRIKDLQRYVISDSGIISFDELTLRGMSVAKIYYCYYGRNAWQWTWATRYSDDCMHSTFLSASLFAERNRVQGSVFYIKELPALFMDCGNCPILVAQINERRPLSAYGSQKIEGMHR